ncbi:MAG: C39 family peptidase [Verrucomicrobiota bacterium]
MNLDHSQITRLFARAALLISLLVTGQIQIQAKDTGFPLPSALKKPEIWDQKDFIDAWQPQKAIARITHKTWPEPPLIFGLRPQQISGHFIDQKLESITLLFLDSGTHFGYIPREQAAATKKMNRESFQALHTETSNKVQQGLQQLTGSKGHPTSLGLTPMLRQNVLLFPSGNLTARYYSIPEQLVKVTFYRDANQAQSLWLDPAKVKLKRRDRIKQLAENVFTAENGDRRLASIPLFPQGDRAYCGVSALAMSMQYMGLNLDTEDYAAAAGIRYGSTKGSKIKEVYEAAGREANMRLSRSTKFDFRKAQAVLDSGLPIIVWRRWAKERDYVHTTFAARFAQDPSALLPQPDSRDRATWPDKKAFSHASVITGYNSKRGEIIFTESWGEEARNRRMRFEEMEGTVYYTFYPKL